MPIWSWWRFCRIGSKAEKLLPNQKVEHFQLFSVSICFSLRFYVEICFCKVALFKNLFLFFCNVKLWTWRHSRHKRRYFWPRWRQRRRRGHICYECYFRRWASASERPRNGGVSERRRLETEKIGETGEKVEPTFWPRGLRGRGGRRKRGRCYEKGLRR